jgi:hypothetical protein
MTITQGSTKRARDVIWVIAMVLCQMPMTRSQRETGGQRLAYGLALGHMAIRPSLGRAPDEGGLCPNFITKMGFLYSFGILLIICLILVDFLHFWEILGIFGAQILGGSWR